MAPEKQIGPPGAAPSFGGSFLKDKVPKIVTKKAGLSANQLFRNRSIRLYTFIRLI